MINPQESISELYVNYAEKMVAYATGKIHNKFTAEELVQDTFLLLTQKWDKLKEHPNLCGWLWKTLSNKIMTEQKSARNKVTFLADNQEIPVFDTYEIEGFEKSLPPQLSQSDKEILILYYEQQRTHIEIAARLNMTVGACKTRLSRARKHYKECLDQNI